jgi:hypothetical protein
MKTEWMDIETAPKDGTRIILFYRISADTMVFGAWNEDKFSRHPKPYWTNDNEYLFGIRQTRNEQPTLWMPSPEWPNTGDF